MGLLDDPPEGWDVEDATETRTVELRIRVTVPGDTTDEQVAESINGALDEPPCVWDDWTVGAAEVVS